MFEHAVQPAGIVFARLGNAWDIGAQIPFLLHPLLVVDIDHQGRP